MKLYAVFHPLKIVNAENLHPGEWYKVRKIEVEKNNVYVWNGAKSCTVKMYMIAQFIGVQNKQSFLCLPDEITNYLHK